MKWDKIAEILNDKDLVLKIRNEWYVRPLENKARDVKAITEEPGVANNWKEAQLHD